MIGLENTQEQHLVLSQKMIQSAEILQMDVQELEIYIQQTALENPLIDLDEQGNEEKAEKVVQQDDDFRRKLEWLNQTDEQNRLYYQQEYEEEKERADWNFAVEENRLKDYLMSQLIMTIQSDKERECVEFLIDCLDSKGYLREDDFELAKKLNVSLEELEACIKLLQSAEPVGVGARTLEECLLLQLDRMWDITLCSEERKVQMECLINDYLEMLGKKRFVQITALSGISTEHVLECFEIIQKMNPIPGNSFSSREKLRYIRPDVAVVKFKEYFEILLNDANIPKIFINRYYLNMMREDDSLEVQDYIKGKYRHAKWVQHCVEERNHTLQKVVREIIEIQKNFFEIPDGKRVPMSLVDIAERLDIHESTVSRAVRGKFLQCAWGVFPLNYFFVKCVAGTEEKRFTPEDVKHKMLEIIEEENKKKPFSDQKIAGLLEEAGIGVSRRTVAKYRMEMILPDASGRKEFIGV